MHPVFEVILIVLQFYIYIVIAMVVMSWLVGFNIVNPNNQFVRHIRHALYRLTEPLLGPIRRLMPDLGGIDVAPVILLVGIFFAQRMIQYYAP